MSERGAGVALAFSRKEPIAMKEDCMDTRALPLHVALCPALAAGNTAFTIHVTVCQVFASEGAVLAPGSALSSPSTLEYTN